jgi:hypothetical protein
MFMDGGPIYKDGDAPIAATNNRMPTVAYDILGTTWTAGQSGDWMIRAFCSPSSALPPYPVIRVLPDTVEFGEATVDIPDTAYFWVYNDGGEPLNVTDINLVPTTLAEVMELPDTVFTVVSLDSHQVMAIWTADTVTTLPVSAKFRIFNNDTTPFPYDVPMTGSATELGVYPIGDVQPDRYALQGSFPNPFNASTRFLLSLPVAGPVSFKIYDVRGREVASLAQGNLTAGSYELTFDASHLTSGLYIARVVAGTFQASQKLVLLK